MRNIIFVLSFLLCCKSAHADVIGTHINNARIVGSGHLKVLVWDIYRATLYAPRGKWNRSQPFALSLRYFTDASGREIADLSVKEIRRLGYSNEIKLAAWHAQMKKMFPDVSKGTVLSGIYKPGQPTRFYKDSRQIGIVKDPEFGTWFFNIWLSQKTSQPKLRAQLLGLK